MPDLAGRAVFVAWLAAIVAIGPLAASALGQSDASDGASAPGSIAFQVDRGEGFFYRVEVGQGTGRTIEGAFDLDQARLTLFYRASPDAKDGLRSVNGSVVLNGIYEFRDTNGNHRFDLGDEVVRFKSVSTSSSTGLEPVQADGPIEGARATYALEEGGRVEWSVYASPRLAFLDDGRPVQPTDTEMTIAVENVEPSGQGTQFGLALRLESGQLEQTGEREVRLQGDRADMVYLWPTTASVDGQPGPIHSTVLEQYLVEDDAERTQAILVNAIPPGDTISTDATIEIEHREPLQERVLARLLGDPLLFSVALIVSILLVGGNAWWRLRGGSGPTDS